jgi:hypothetical protein
VVIPGPIAQGFTRIRSDGVWLKRQWHHLDAGDAHRQAPSLFPREAFGFLVPCWEAVRMLFELTAPRPDFKLRRQPPERQMNKLIAWTGFMMLSVCCCLASQGQDAPDKGKTALAVKSVLAEKQRAGLMCARIVIDNGQIASVYLHGVDYLRALKKIDTTGCPEGFRAAWSDYLSVWNRKLETEKATEETADAISMWKGGYDDLPATVRRIEAYDTESAWENCESAALKWGRFVHN